MGSDEGHFNVSLIVGDKVTNKTVSTTIFEEEGEPKRNRTEVLLLIRHVRENIMLIRDGEKGGRWYGGRGRGRLYTYRYNVTTRMTSALKWASMRAVLIFH